MEVTQNISMPHDASTNVPTVNNTRLHRFLTLAALRTTGKFFKSYGTARRISRRIIVKNSRSADLNEAITLQFIAQHTSIPVPRVYCSFTRKGCQYIVMEYIKGEAINLAMQKLDEPAKQKVWNGLRALLTELRSLQRPAACGVQSCTGGSLYDFRISRSPHFGPFNDINAFHLWLRDGYDGSENDPTRDYSELKLMIELQDRQYPPPVFTHADLNPTNILVRGDEVVGIIDWAFSGWYPHYWEYTSAWMTLLLATDWQADLSKFLDPCPTELRMDLERWRWWGEI